MTGLHEPPQRKDEQTTAKAAVKAEAVVKREATRKAHKPAAQPAPVTPPKAGVADGPGKHGGRRAGASRMRRPSARLSSG